jgi:hypothetical protein
LNPRGPSDGAKLVAALPPRFPMSRTSAGTASLKVNALRVLAVLVPVALLVFLLLGLAAAVADRSLTIAFGEGERERGTAWFEWDGDVEASDITLYPRGRAAEASAVRFDRVHVQTPGWIWILAHVLDRGLETARLDRLQITLEGVSSGAGLDPTLGQLGPVGAASASPFETEGCMQDVHWSRVALDTMGLSPGTTRLDYDFRVEEDVRLVTRITLATRGASRIQLDRMSDLAQPAQALQLHLQPAVIRSERWEVEDAGFVSARNRFCTKKDGIDLRRFIERHVESVERLLESAGIRLDPDSRIAYRRFARDGGKLAFGGTYEPPLSAEEFTALRPTGAALARLRARIDHNGRGNEIAWTRVPARPLRLEGDAETTYAALQREHVAQLRGQTLDPTGPDDAAAPAAGVDGSVAATNALDASGTSGTVAEAPAPAPASAPQPPSAGEPDAAPAASIDAGVATEAAVPPAQADAPTVTPDATPVVATPTPAPPSPPVSTRRRIEWDDLPRYRGRLVRIWTVHNPPRTVEILSADADALRVTVRLGGGQGEYTIQRDGFLRATLVR